MNRSRVVPIILVIFPIDLDVGELIELLIFKMVKVIVF